MIRILIVDDAPGWVNYHKTNIEYLNIKGIEIETAYSAKEAFMKVETSIVTPYDVIFTDLQMEKDYLPRLAGEWLIEQIKTHKQYSSGSKSNIVIISASAEIQKTARAHDVLYLPKTVVRNSDSEIYRQFIPEKEI